MPQKVRPHAPCKGKSFINHLVLRLLSLQGAKVHSVNTAPSPRKRHSVFGRSNNIAFYDAARLNMQSHSVIRSFYIPAHHT